jgi:ribokinase
MIVVVGSLNMDFVVSVEHLPAPGETILGQNFVMLPGGKGANQAHAAGRLHSKDAPRVKMIGRIGLDVFGDHLKASLSAAGVDVNSVHASRSQATGVALIAVDRSGQNSIVVASGANMELAASDVEAMRKVFQGALVALFQLETPLDTVAAALKVARSEGLTTILDPAPAQSLSDALLADVDILTPNEGEALAMLEKPPRRVDVRLDVHEARTIAALLRERGPRIVIVKLGEQGCFADDGKIAIHYPGHVVKVVDTTAAGDTFNAALAVALSERQELPAAIRFANAAAALSVTRAGAQASAPSREEVETLLSSAT